MENEKVSLVIGTRNPNRQWLDEALASAEGLFDEVIVVDDGSDVPVEGATVRHEVNMGFYEARNTGCRLAKGPWIASLDDDDLFIREHVGVLKDVMGSFRADVIHFPCLLFGDQKGMWGDRPDFSRILDANQIPSGSWFRKDVWERLRGFRFKAGEDWDFWARATKHGFRFKGFSLPVYMHRMRAGSMSAGWVGERFLQIREDIRKSYEEERI